MKRLFYVTQVTSKNIVQPLYTILFMFLRVTIAMLKGLVCEQFIPRLIRLVVFIIWTKAKVLSSIV